MKIIILNILYFFIIDISISIQTSSYSPESSLIPPFCWMLGLHSHWWTFALPSTARRPSDSATSIALHNYISYSHCLFWSHSNIWTPTNFYIWSIWSLTAVGSHYSHPIWTLSSKEFHYFPMSSTSSHSWWIQPSGCSNIKSSSHSSRFPLNKLPSESSIPLF